MRHLLPPWRLLQMLGQNAAKCPQGFFPFRLRELAPKLPQRNTAIPRRLALPRSVKHWSLTTLREKLIKIGAKVVTHAGYVIFQMAEVAVPRELFAAILERIQWFGVPPPLVQRG